MQAPEVVLGAAAASQVDTLLQRLSVELLLRILSNLKHLKKSLVVSSVTRKEDTIISIMEHCAGLGGAYRLLKALAQDQLQALVTLMGVPMPAGRPHAPALQLLVLREWSEV